MKKSRDPKKLYPVPPYSGKVQRPPGSDARMRPLADHGENTYIGKQLLVGRKALITGGDSGIGRAVALAFAREGADVAISFLPSEKKDAAETEALIKESGHKAVLLPGDISSKAVCHRIAEKAVKSLGGIDILVNNAAFQRTYKKLSEIPDEEFEKCYRVNVFAMHYLCKALLPKIREGGSIINTASIQSFDPGPHLIAYASTKAAIVSYTSTLATFAMEHGVRVNAVAPGPVWTPLIPSTMEKSHVKKFGENTVFGRAAQPAEMAPLFVFLASDLASYVTGEVYGATGGRMPM